MKKKYLGDSVYFDFDGFNVILTTENGMGPSNEIYMEPEVVLALMKTLSDLAEEIKRSKDNSKAPEEKGV